MQTCEMQADVQLRQTTQETPDMLHLRLSSSTPPSRFRSSALFGRGAPSLLAETPRTSHEPASSGIGRDQQPNQRRKGARS